METRYASDPCDVRRRICNFEMPMPICQHCASNDLHWFTPQRYADRAAVLLCMSCQRLTIVAPHAHNAHRHPQPARSGQQRVAAQRAA
jgi:hypothetical protein